MRRSNSPRRHREHGEKNVKLDKRTPPAMKPQGKLYQEKLTGEIIGAAIEVHRQLGPGLLESTYAACLCRELELRDISFECQKPLPGIQRRPTRLWLWSRPLGSGL